MIGFGVPAGATKPLQDTETKFFTSLSSSVGTIGICVSLVEAPRCRAAGPSCR